MAYFRLLTITFSIPGKPVGKARPRFGRGHVYTPQETRQYEQFVGWTAKAAGAQPLDNPIRVEIKAYGKGKEERPWIGKPDIDNIAKIILDGLSEIAYINDNQVIELIVTKSHSPDPRVDVSVTYLPKPLWSQQ